MSINASLSAATRRANRFFTANAAPSSAACRRRVRSEQVRAAKQLGLQGPALQTFIKSRDAKNNPTYAEDLCTALQLDALEHPAPAPVSKWGSLRSSYQASWERMGQRMAQLRSSVDAALRGAMARINDFFASLMGTRVGAEPIPSQASSEPHTPVSVPESHSEPRTPESKISNISTVSTRSEELRSILSHKDSSRADTQQRIRDAVEAVQIPGSPVDLSSARELARLHDIGIRVWHTTAVNNVYRLRTVAGNRDAENMIDVAYANGRKQFNPLAFALPCPTPDTLPDGQDYCAATLVDVGEPGNSLFLSVGYQLENPAITALVDSKSRDAAWTQKCTELTQATRQETYNALTKRYPA